MGYEHTARIIFQCLYQPKLAGALAGVRRRPGALFAFDEAPRGVRHELGDIREESEFAAVVQAGEQVGPPQGGRLQGDRYRDRHGRLQVQFLAHVFDGRRVERFSKLVGRNHERQTPGAVPVFAVRTTPGAHIDDIGEQGSLCVRFHPNEHERPIIRHPL